MKYLTSLLSALTLSLASCRTIEPVHESKIIHIRQTHCLSSDVASAINSHSNFDVLRKLDPTIADQLEESIKARRLKNLMALYGDVRKSQEKIDKTLDSLIKESGSLEVYAEGLTDVEEDHLQNPYFLEGKYVGRLVTTEQILEKQGLDLPISTHYFVLRAVGDIAKEYLSVRNNEFSTPLEFLESIYNGVVDQENLNADFNKCLELTDQYLAENGIEADSTIRNVYRVAFSSRIAINNYRHDLLKVLIGSVDSMKDVNDAKRHFNAFFNKVYLDRKEKFAPYRLIPGAALVKAMHGKLTLHHLDKKSLVDKAVENLRNGSSLANPEFDATVEEREDYMVRRLSNRDAVIILGGTHNLENNVNAYMAAHPNTHITLDVIDDRADN